MKSLKNTINESFVNEGKEITAHVISVGKVNPNVGVTDFGWKIYETWPKGMEAYYFGWGYLFGTKGSLKVGDNVILRGNDSGRKLKNVKIIDVCPVDRDKMLEMTKKNGWDFYPKKPFAKKAAGMQNNTRFGVSYSIKGIE